VWKKTTKRVTEGNYNQQLAITAKNYPYHVASSKILSI